MTVMQYAGTAQRTLWSIELPHSAAAVPIARALIRDVLAEVAPEGGDPDTAELLTAELVANAVLHTPAGTPVRLVVELLPAGFRIEVQDGAPEPVPGLTVPLQAAASPFEMLRQSAPEPVEELCENGRGLLLIRTLSAAAGCRPTPHGKAVWFRLPTAV
ncbi:ATP-binding protein [Streptomyces sp. NPDC051940]|uniref:ATP-binding protein n=1 Tax=Streptomyces sp. NPDC051940 TaxID=3155675 RepID=UPI00341B28CB